MDLAHESILITGITGFAGSFLLEHLLKAGCRQIHGLTRGGIKKELPGAILHEVDYHKPGQLVMTLERINPARIFHLAGFAQTGSSFANESLAWEGNLGATQALLGAIIQTRQRPKILAAGSGLIYGPSQFPGEIKDEKSELLPESPYASSKAAMDLYCYQSARNHGLEILRARPFNHIGPRQGDDFAIPSFCRQIAEIELGVKPPCLVTGNLGSYRDFTDVRDMVRGYHLLMESGLSPESYNLASGKNILMRDALEALIKLSKCPNIEIRENMEKHRGPEVYPVQASNLKLEKCTGWQPEIALEQTLKDTLNYWRSKSSNSGSKRSES